MVRESRSIYDCLCRCVSIGPTSFDRLVEDDTFSICLEVVHEMWYTHVVLRSMI